MMLSVSEMVQALESGRTTSVEIVEGCLQTIRLNNPRLNAFIEVFDKEALASAAQSDERRKKGACLSALDGVPVAVKDNICIKGHITSAASKMLANFVSPYDATAIHRVKAAGMPILGRLNMDEFGMGSSTENSFYGPAHHPLDESLVTGGSSGGAAAAVAAGMVPAALGSDTGGSIRQPAALCGAFGVKPAYGSISRYGLIAFASSLDQIGVITAGARDAALLMDVLCGADEHDLTTVHGLYQREERALADCRFALPEECFSDGLHPDVRKALLHAADQLQQTGARVETVSIPLLSHALDAYYVLSSAEASSNLARYDGMRYGFCAENCSETDERYRKTRQQGFGMEVKRRILLGTYALSSGYQQQYYLKALEVQKRLNTQISTLLEGYHGILMPVSPVPAWPIGQKTDPMTVYQGDIDTVPANLCGLPAVSIPCGCTTDGLPVGLGLMAGKTKLGLLLNLCTQLEEVFHRGE